MLVARSMAYPTFQSSLWCLLEGAHTCDTACVTLLPTRLDSCLATGLLCFLAVLVVGEELIGIDVFSIEQCVVLCGESFETE